MAFSESFLSNAGWLFFAAWSAIITAIGIAAFGRDLLPWTDSAHKSQPSNQPAPHPHRTR
ncbi:MAG TPA: hypothetical protein VFL34_17525 [Candidatus Sulfotelmatobacter sp.]|nr:hypothetical protein [Candidatus Sulfotelmatobacter sp.]